MANVGDTKTRFGREYIFLNPEPSEAGAETVAYGHWRLKTDDTGTPPINGGGGGNSELIFRAVVASDVPTVAVGNLVYIDDIGEMRLASASTYDTSIVAGMAIEAGVAGDTISFSRNVVESIFDVPNLVDGSPNFLEPGEMYYLSTNAGKWTRTPDTTTAGAAVRVCGTAVAPNDMSIEIQIATVI